MYIQFQSWLIVALLSFIIYSTQLDKILKNGQKQVRIDVEKVAIATVFVQNNILLMKINTSCVCSICVNFGHCIPYC